MYKYQPQETISLADRDVLAKGVTSDLQQYCIGEPASLTLDLGVTAHRINRLGARMSENKNPALCVDTLRWAANVIHNELRGGGPLAMKLNLLPQEVEIVAEQIADILLKESAPKDSGTARCCHFCSGTGRNDGTQ